jgi:heme exporter protein A
MQACRLTANNLACQRGERLLFRGLGLELRSGQALQVKGANGIGKSSLIRILAGLLRPLVGEVEREGSVGLLDERPALDPGLPLGHALGFWQRLDGPGDAELAQLGLSGLLEVPVRYLSTGQKKRAALARLLGQEASIWLLDEPLNGLDTRGVALVEALVAQHCAQGGIALVASHQPIALPGGTAIDLADFTE